MKSRFGFVSNSSSSSFLIPKIYLSEMQIDQIKRHGEICNVEYDDRWSIGENEIEVTGYTGQDNFDMHDFMRKIGINMEKVEWR